MERADDGNTKLPKAASAVVLGHEVDDLRVAVTDMHPDSQIEAAHVLVERIEIGIGDEPVPFDATHEYAAGAVLLAEPQFLQRRAHIKQRQNAYPSQTSLALLVNVGKPAVVALANSDLPLRLVRYLFDKNRRIEHLDVNT